MPQLTISNKTYKVTIGNIERVFKSATTERIAETRKWYQNAQDFTKAVANQLNANDVSRFKVSGVISAISPRNEWNNCLLYTSPSPRDKRQSRMPSSA